MHAILEGQGVNVVPVLSDTLSLSEKVIRRCLGTLEHAGLVDRCGEFRPRYEPSLPDARKWIETNGHESVPAGETIPEWLQGT